MRINQSEWQAADTNKARLEWLAKKWKAPATAKRDIDKHADQIITKDS